MKRGWILYAYIQKGLLADDQTPGCSRSAKSYTRKRWRAYSRTLFTPILCPKFRQRTFSDITPKINHYWEPERVYKNTGHRTLKILWHYISPITSDNFWVQFSIHLWHKQKIKLFWSPKYVKIVLLDGLILHYKYCKSIQIFQLSC